MSEVAILERRIEALERENARFRAALEEIAMKSEHEARFLGMDDSGMYQWEFGCVVVARVALEGGEA